MSNITAAILAKVTKAWSRIDDSAAIYGVASTGNKGIPIVATDLGGLVVAGVDTVTSANTEGLLIADTSNHDSTAIDVTGAKDFTVMVKNTVTTGAPGNLTMSVFGSVDGTNFSATAIPGLVGTALAANKAVAEGTTECMVFSNVALKAIQIRLASASGATGAKSTASVVKVLQRGWK